MKFKYIAMMMISLLVSSGPAIASDAQEYVSNAIQHAEDAEIHGRAGHTNALLEYAHESLTHAQAAYQKAPETNQHLANAIKLLQEAISQAKQDRIESATGHVREALSHMRR